MSTTTYTCDGVSRRTDVVHSGTAFIAMQYIEFGYNDRSELTVIEEKGDYTGYKDLHR